MRKTGILVLLVTMLALTSWVASAHGPNAADVHGVHCHGYAGFTNETYVEPTPGTTVGIHTTATNPVATTRLITPTAPPSQPTADECISP